MKLSGRAIQVAEWSALAGVGATGLFNAAVPTPYEIRHDLLVGDVAQNVADLRDCYRKALVGSLLLGVVSAAIVESLLPLLATAAADGVMLWGYESALPAAYRLRSPFELLGTPATPGVIDGEFRRVS